MSFYPCKLWLVCGLGGLIGIIAIACSPLIHSTSSTSAISDSTAVTRAPIDPQTLNQRWVVSADEATQLIRQGATLLDARGRGNSTLAEAVRVTWQQFSQSQSPHRGQLLTDDALLTQKLQAVGVSTHRPVVVVGDTARGWGEDGRIVWMLRSLGHRQAVLVDGGYAALDAVGVPAPRQGVDMATVPGDFVVNRTDTWAIERDEVRSRLTHPNVVILDARETREFEGATPYGETRGGHIPGAIHFYYRDLLDANGNILPRDQILAKLEAAGISPDAEIISYCTGGIRSAWLTVVLSDVGLHARNYAGSMWEWSAAPAPAYPLQRGKN